MAAKFILERILGRPQTIDLYLVAINSRVDEMKVESKEINHKEVMKLFPIISLWKLLHLIINLLLNNCKNEVLQKTKS